MARYKKLAGVYYRVENGVKKMYKRGDIIEATEEELKQTDPTLNSWKAMEPEKAAEEARIASAAPLIEVTRVAKLKRGATEKYDVVNPKSKKVLNDVPLAEAEADSLVGDNPPTDAPTKAVKETKAKDTKAKG